MADISLTRVVLLLSCFQSALCFLNFLKIAPGEIKNPFCSDSQPWDDILLNAGHGLTSELNPFGKDFYANGHVWNSALCQTDSDGDGLTNGVELRVPDCTKEFEINETWPLTHPGVCNSENIAMNCDKLNRDAGLKFTCESVPNPDTWAYVWYNFYRDAVRATNALNIAGRQQQNGLRLSQCNAENDNFILYINQQEQINGRGSSAQIPAIQNQRGFPPVQQPGTQNQRGFPTVQQPATQNQRGSANENLFQAQNPRDPANANLFQVQNQRDPGNPNLFQGQNQGGAANANLFQARNQRDPANLFQAQNQRNPAIPNLFQAQNQRGPANTNLFQTQNQRVPSNAQLPATQSRATFNPLSQSSNSLFGRRLA